MASDHKTIKALQLPLERDMFCRTLIRELTGTLQDVVGLQEASGFISIAGQRIGEMINKMYQNGLNQEQLNRSEVALVLEDLKRRIQGDFTVVEENDEKIVLENRSCPFGDKVIGRPSLCMMTSNVFGHIVAENLGYSKVVIEKAIAQGDDGCRVAVHLKPTADSSNGKEYFRE